MLQHEQTDPPAVSPTIPLPVPNAADARVTPDELNAALKVLEDQQASTVTIGSVVDELRLNATPEQIWEQVQKQRAQEETQRRFQEEKRRAQEEATKMSQSASAQTAVRPRRLRWHRRWWLFLGIGSAIYWIAQGSLLPSHLLVTSPVVTNPGQTITINGDLTKETISAQGKDIVISGDLDDITLQGQARSVTISGDFDTLHGDTPRSYIQAGDFDNAKWISAP